MITLLNKLRKWFLSPDSRLELGLRTLYHKILATRLAFLVQDWLAKRSYRKWRRKHLNRSTNHIDDFQEIPLVSFVLFCPEGLTPEAQATIQSIKNLQGESREVILFVPGEVQNQDNLSAVQAKSDIRSVVRQIEDVLDVANGEFLVFCATGDQFYDPLLIRFYQSVEKDSSIDLIYYDCEYFDVTSGQMAPHFKPDKISPELLLSVNYLSRGFFRTDAARQVVANIELPKNFFAFEYALALKISEKQNSTSHLPAMLAMQTSLVLPKDDLRDVITKHLSRQGLDEVSYEEHFYLPRFIWKVRDPYVAMVILTKNHHNYLENLLKSIDRHTRHSNYEILIVDNGSDDQTTLAYYEKIDQVQNIRIVVYDKPFNYSEAINLGVGSSDSDLVLLLNDDMKVGNDIWLDELTQWAIRPEIGVVGAKLLRENHTIQHAGIIMGLNGFAGHLYLNAPEHYHGLFGPVDWYRNVLAVTGACQMIRREVFDAVGGYDEGYQLAFGDIDFCLRVHQVGYSNMVTPFTNIFHYEGLTRGYTTPTGDILKGLDDMEGILVEGDPYYSPHLSLTRIPKCDLSPSSRASRIHQIESRKAFYKNAEKWS
jgi:GT2 family glycosyltransferase